MDAFATGPGYKQTLIFPDKRFPVGHWYHVAQTYDGATYRSFVDGVLQGEAPLAFTPEGPGRSSPDQKRSAMCSVSRPGVGAAPGVHGLHSSRTGCSPGRIRIVG